MHLLTAFAVVVSIATPALRVLDAPQTPSVHATPDITDQLVVHAQHARQTPALHAVDALHLPVVPAMLVTLDLTEVHARHAPSENTKPRPARTRAPIVKPELSKPRPAGPCAPIVEPVSIRHQQPPQLRRLVSRVRLAPGRHAADVVHLPVVPVIWVILDLTEVHAPLAQLESIKTRPARPRALIA